MKKSISIKELQSKYEMLSSAHTEGKLSAEVIELFADDIIMVGPGTQFFEGKKELVTWLTDFYRTTTNRKVKFSILEFKKLNETLAMELGQYSLSFTAEDNTHVEENGFHLIHWQFTRNGWQIVLDIATGQEI